MTKPKCATPLNEKLENAMVVVIFLVGRVVGEGGTRIKKDALGTNRTSGSYTTPRDQCLGTTH